MKWIVSFAATKLPEFLDKPKNCTAAVKGDAVFESVISGEPLPKVKWLKDGIEMFPSNRYRMDIIGDKARLTIKNVHEGDTGTVTCELVNPAGTESATAQLKVQSEY